VLGNTSQQKAPLSIDLQYFRLKSNNHYPEILWGLTAGHKVKYLDVERSHNGVDFVSIKRITESTNEVAYHTAYKDMFASSGWNFYRLHLTDLNRDNFYSNIEKIWIDETSDAIQIFPNPVKERMSLRIANPAKVNRIHVLNNMGQRIITIHTPVKFQEISCVSFPTGNYFIQTFGSCGSTLMRFIKN
jgi:hypothetical protein